MPEEYQLPVEGYQQSYADPMGYALPVAQPDNSRIYISPKPDVIPTRDEPILHSSGKQLKAVDYDPWSNLGMAGVEDKSGQSEHPLLKQLFGLGGEDRVQLWPERMVRAGVTAAGNVMSGQTPQWAVDPETGDVHTSPQMIEAGLDTAALAGTGGLAGTTEATLGSGPFLRPALKHNGKIYKGKEGQQHLDVLPKELQADFNQKAMTGEDISHYNFGFMNHKGQFLNREAALDYAVKEGLVDPTAGQYGVLTSTLLSDSSKPGIAIEAMKKPTFYSALEHNVNNIGQAKMTGDQWLGTLANKSGVKPEELQWTGLSDFLAENKGKVVTKEQIQQHLEQNKVELKEITKGGDAQTNPKEYYDAQKKVGEPEWSQLNQRERAYWSNEADVNKTGNTKYHSYQLPGGENYREMLMTLPDKNPLVKLNAEYKALSDEFLKNKTLTPEKQARWAQVEEEITKLRKEGVDTDAGKYRSSHWDEPNILAHVRMNDRTIEGKKSLHLEEIQSDWHQQGREKGYKNPEDQKKYDAASKAVEDARTELRNRKEPPNLDQINEILSPLLDARDKAVAANVNTVPDAPFKKTWHELALKRMLREAAEKGYNRLSWTPGEAQAARYDLSKSVDSINVKPEHGNKLVEINPKGGKQIGVYVNDKGNVIPNAGYDVHAKPYEGKALSDIVGKETADKILKLKNGRLAGENLKIGGEGMKGFYDKMIPNALEKLGKEHGVKVKQSSPKKIEASPEEINKLAKTLYESYDRLGGEPLWKDLAPDKQKKYLENAKEKSYLVDNSEPKVHYIDIPQSLKDTVLRKGQPLFSSAHPGVTFSQVDHNPFEDKSK